ncbi:MAG: hypothetical protein LBV80_06060 [Deltaproteobacteria bacterium]|nr:hypothetical protein [Deltaproteobacteria bacterium]
MSLADATLAELAASFQLPSLAFNENNVAALRIGGASDADETDFVSFEKRGDSVFLSVARPLPPHRAGLAEQALRLCGKEGGFSIPIRAGLTSNGRLVFITRFTQSSFTLSETVRRITALRDAHSRLGDM